jgi:hypothetical protein
VEQKNGCGVSFSPHRNPVKELLQVLFSLTQIQQMKKSLRANIKFIGTSVNYKIPLIILERIFFVHHSLLIPIILIAALNYKPPIDLSGNWNLEIFVMILLTS